MIGRLKAGASRSLNAFEHAAVLPDREHKCTRKNVSTSRKFIAGCIYILFNTLGILRLKCPSGIQYFMSIQFSQAYGMSSCIVVVVMIIVTSFMAFTPHYTTV